VSLLNKQNKQTKQNKKQTKQIKTKQNKKNKTIGHPLLRVVLKLARCKRVSFPSLGKGEGEEDKNLTSQSAGALLRGRESCTLVLHWYF